MEINLADVVAEVQAAFDSYERALMAKTRFLRDDVDADPADGFTVFVDGRAARIAAETQRQSRQFDV